MHRNFRSAPPIGARYVSVPARAARGARAGAAFRRGAAPLDLTQGQFSLLTSLNRPEPPSIGSVAALLAMDRTTLTANLKPLERRGLVKIAVDKEDRRSRRLVLTAAGRALLGKAFPIWKKDARRDRKALHGISARRSARRIARACLIGDACEHDHFDGPLPRYSASRAMVCARPLSAP